MATSYFIHPKEMKHRGKKETISFRIDVSIKALLQKYADEYDLSLAELIVQVVEKYAETLEKEGKNEHD